MRQLMTAQRARDRPRGHAEFGADPVRAAPFPAAQLHDAPLGLCGGTRRHRMRPRRAIVQPRLTLGGEAVQPRLHALAGDPHRRRDMRLGPPGPMPPGNQQPALERGAGITRET